MKFYLSESIREFLTAFTNYLSKEDEIKYISYADLRKFWDKYRKDFPDCNKFASFHSLVRGTSLEWESFYPKTKVKTSEEMKVYKARLQELEYKQLTKNMEDKPNDYFKVSIYEIQFLVL